jgi:hypothetical protein
MQLRGKWDDMPRDKDDNPKFRSLKELGQFFREDEIVELVNRELYRANMQRMSHAKNYRSKRTMNETKPLGRPKGVLNTNTTKGEVKELAKVAQKEANEALRREAEAMEKWAEQQKDEKKANDASV